MRAIRIIDQETGEWYYTCHSKYGGQATVDNALRYCQRHGLQYVRHETDFRGHAIMWVVEKEDE